jgi:hypothetical protein
MRLTSVKTAVAATSWVIVIHDHQNLNMVNYHPNLPRVGGFCGLSAYGLRKESATTRLRRSPNFTLQRLQLPARSLGSGVSCISAIGDSTRHVHDTVLLRPIPSVVKRRARMAPPRSGSQAADAPSRLSSRRRAFLGGAPGRHKKQRGLLPESAFLIQWQKLPASATTATAATSGAATRAAWR